MLLLLCLPLVAAFVLPPQEPPSFVLCAATKKKKVAPARGFGALPPCPCASGKTSDKCCDVLVRDLEARRLASPGAIVRSRYTAYARNDCDYVIATTHPRNPDFQDDKKKWRKELEANAYKDYAFLGAVVTSEKVTDTKGEVVFVAKLRNKKTKDRADFTEHSFFERGAEGDWQYVGGDIKLANSDLKIDNSLRLEEEPNQQQEENLLLNKEQPKIVQ